MSEEIEEIEELEEGIDLEELVLENETKVSVYAKEYEKETELMDRAVKIYYSKE